MIDCVLLVLQALTLAYPLFCDPLCPCCGHSRWSKEAYEWACRRCGVAYDPVARKAFSQTNQKSGGSTTSI